MTTAAPERRLTPVPTDVLHRARHQLYSTMAKGLSTETLGLEEFFVQAWPIIEQGTPLQSNWAIGYVCEHLEAVALGQLLRLAISIPPREGKSNLVTIAFPDWVWTRWAWKRFMAVSYARELATDHSVKRRRILESRWYQEKWGGVFQLASDQNQKAYFENTAGGSMMGAGAGGAATGKGANIQIFDDFINPKEAESETERKAKIEIYKNTFSNRLNDAKHDARIIVAQRTHRNDLTGYVLKEEGGYTHIELPIIASERVTYSFPRSARQVVREVGDILNPARHDASTIASQRRSSGSRAFSAQYLCTPSKDDGSMCPQAWWQFYHEDPRHIFAKGQVKAQTWDFAFKDLETSSFVVGYAMVRIGQRKYVCAERRDHLNFPATCKAVQAMDAQWPGCEFKFYEARANGPAVEAQMKGKIRGLIPVEPIGSKPARFAAASPDIEAGDVLLPYPWDKDGHVLPERQWVLDLMDEVERFPEEPNDRGDALGQGIIKLNNVALYQEDANDEGGSILMNGESGDDTVDAIDLIGNAPGYNDGWAGGDDGTL